MSTIITDQIYRPLKYVQDQGTGPVLTSDIPVMNKHPFAVAGLSGSNIGPHLCCSYCLTSLLESLEVWEAELFCFCLLLFFFPFPLSVFLTSSLKKVKPIFQSLQETNYSNNPSFPEQGLFLSCSAERLESKWICRIRREMSARFW